MRYIIIVYVHISKDNFRRILRRKSFVMTARNPKEDLSDVGNEP